MGRRCMQCLFFLPLLLLFACAPDNLDITPTPVPTAVPMITVYVTGAVTQSGVMIEIPQGSRVSDAIEAAGGALETADLQHINLASIVRDGDQIHVLAQNENVAESTAEATEAVVTGSEQTLLDHLLSAVPGSINAGVINWRRDTSIETLFVERDDGVTGRMTYTEAGGGLMELTLGVFNSRDAAIGYYETRVRSLEAQSRTQERDLVPTPNAFGSGAYGSAVVFVQDNIVVHISIPRFSSTAGDPLAPMGRQMVTILEQALAAAP
jgi:DNA uptake protein ComE-like DNA-binding protein